MKVTPISETVAHSQANAFGLWPKGKVDFEVLTAIDKHSKAGNPMSELKLRLHNAEGKTRMQDDWLVESEATSYKVRHFAAAVGMLAQYEKGDMPASDMVGKTGQLMLGVEKGKPVPDGSGNKYPDKNKVLDYIPRGGPLIASVAQPGMDDEIPFS